MEEENVQIPIAGRSRLRLFLYLLGFLLLVGFVIIWFSRISIADNLVRSELEALDVEASYEIEDIGFSKQVIRNLIIGDPANPDLTAELVELGNSLSIEGAGINWVRASGVKLFGRFSNGKLSLGELDKFMNPNDESPLALPDIWLGVEKAKLRIDSDYGALGISVSGTGNLQNGFDGELAAIGRELEFSGCTMMAPSYFGEISIRSKKPKLDGPLRLESMRCDEAGFASERIAAKMALELGSDLASWTGDVGVVAGPVRFGEYRARNIKSSIGLSGDLNQSKGVVNLTATGLNSPYASAGLGRVEGPFAIGYGGEVLSASFRGAPDLTSVRLSNNLSQQVKTLAEATVATPVGPIAAKLAQAVQNAGAAMDLSSDLRFTMDNSGSKLALNDLELQSRTGAVLQLQDPLLLTLSDDKIQMLADGSLTLAGGGFPNLSVTLNDGSLSDGFSGDAQMAAYQAGASNMIVPTMRFSPSGRGGTNIDGRIILSGPVPDGQLTGLQIPISGSISGDGDFTLFRRCVDLQFASLTSAEIAVGPTRTRLCPGHAGAVFSSNGSATQIAANVPSFNLSGSVGNTPWTVASRNISYSSAQGMRGDDVSVRLGEAEDLTQFNMALLTAVFGRTVTGQISGADGQIASVPLLMENVEGEWTYADGMFGADAKLRVRDEQQVERFRPLMSNDVRLTFENGKILANGLLREPKTERKVASITMEHALSDNSGQAQIDVGWLTFDEELQPEMLTPLSLGVVANVEGTITGTGQINWDNKGDGVRSTGKFRTNSVNLAAAFGPVTGLSGEIEFSDLLGLETKTGQLVRMAEVNPGVAAFNGRLSYRLLPDYKMQIEGGQWPFAGGMLYLEPTIMDLGEEAVRQLEFKVEGVDAAKFLTQFDFENLNATGVFDGKLPMVFDQDGGRIVGGYLKAREGGGTLAYIGQLTYEDMGTMANFAFDALKSLKYNDLVIGMDGDIAGEIITQVKFGGLKQGDDASKNFITKQLARLPIEFNVRIQAPFMQLMSSAKSYYEPELLVGQNLPALLRAQEARAEEAAKAIESKNE